ncbi:quinone oxidoreductase [Chloroflexia bacterium SDU3-3]|nr:quinone oxidoreductase [Chloroflexia bacterium SDU3-3]
MKAIRVHEFGGPEQLRYDEIPTPEPGPGQARVKIGAAGVNFIDIYHRSGTYPNQLPMVLGSEAAGTVDAVGEGVADVRVGDRVAYCGVVGSYAEYAVVPAARLVPVPEGISDEVAAAAMLQGITAHYLVDATYPVKRGDTVLLHAAAGGVGLLLVQLAKQRGARLIGTVSTEEKAERILALGADEAILYTEQDFEAEVKRLTGGRGVDVVYDSVGKTTFEKSLASLRPRGMMVLFGQSSGLVPPIDPNILQRYGSIYLTRPTMGHYIASRDELLYRAGAVLSALDEGTLDLRIDRSYPLAQAGQAQADLASRATSGKVLLIPERA